jgi:hypothetical protein
MRQRFINENTVKIAYTVLIIFVLYITLFAVGVGFSYIARQDNVSSVKFSIFNTLSNTFANFGTTLMLGLVITLILPDQIKSVMKSVGQKYELFNENK